MIKDERRYTIPIALVDDGERAKLLQHPDKMPQAYLFQKGIQVSRPNLDAVKFSKGRFTIVADGIEYSDKERGKANFIEKIRTQTDYDPGVVVTLMRVREENGQLIPEFCMVREKRYWADTTTRFPKKYLVEEFL